MTRRERQDPGDRRHIADLGQGFQPHLLAVQQGRDAVGRPDPRQPAGLGLHQGIHAPIAHEVARRRLARVAVFGECADLL